MQFGAVFPNNSIGADLVAARDFAQGIEALGFDYLTTFDHVFGASAAAFDQARLAGPYREADVFHEPFMLFAWLAGQTRALGFATGIMILPQRQALLAAKQAAMLDLYCHGRFRLGIGSGWNWTEYEALGADWATRGARLEEQISVMRALWTEPVTSFAGSFHSIPPGGINPLPCQRPIPVWLGGVSEPQMRRVGRLADGWMPIFRSLEPGNRSTAREVLPEEALARVHDYARQAGRDPASISLECRLTHQAQSEPDWSRLASRYSSLGATHLTLVTGVAPGKNVEQHLRELAVMKQAAAG